jgi:hypothetical protein
MWGVLHATTSGRTGQADEVEVDWDLTALQWDDVRVRHVPLDGQLSPEAVGPGGEVTVTAECNLQQLSDPIHDHEVHWALVEEGTFPGWEGLPEGLSFSAVDQGTVPVPGPDAEDAYIWEVIFEAPAEPGEYEFVAICAPVDLESYPHCDIGTYGPADLTLEVDEDIPVDEPEDEPEEEEEEEEEEDEPEVRTPAPTPVTGEPVLTG